jgi:hypothetical protein
VLATLLRLTTHLPEETECLTFRRVAKAAIAVQNVLQQIVIVLPGSLSMRPPFRSDCLTAIE